MAHADANDAAVTALRYDEPATCAELAEWSGGTVEWTPEGEQIVVPTVDGPRTARLGDWIVRYPDGTHGRYSPEDFLARFVATPGAVPQDQTDR